jgi:hypothetical protein
MLDELEIINNQLKEQKTLNINIKNEKEVKLKE